MVLGDVNVSLLLGSARTPVVGFVMYDYYEFGSLPRVATFALLVTAVTLVCVGTMMALVNRGRK
jgi:ABC-type spermidine/putrescine transport system permease subunit II